jgi:hypothetical protein
MAENIVELILEQMELGISEDLILDGINIGHFTPFLRKEIEKYTQIKGLSLVNCLLKGLEDFPILPDL